MNYLFNSIYCKKDAEYISLDLWVTWKDLVGKIGCYHNTSYGIYHHLSDEVYYGQGGPPPPKNEDILCIIHYSEQKAGYFYKGKDFDNVKDYICALKNIAFL